MPMIGHIRLGLLCVAWMAALIQVITGANLIEVVNLGVIAFITFVILTLTIVALAHDRRGPIRNDAFGGSTKMVTIPT